MRYFNLKNQDTTPRKASMAQDDIWSIANDPAMLSDFSPNLNTLDGHGSTVSPTEILMNHTMPASAFSSPYLFDSPPEGYDTSPLFGTDDINENWPSLFPSTNPVDSEDIGSTAQAAGNSGTDNTSLVDSDSPGTSPSFRNMNSIKDQKRSATVGVRKRVNPLPPIHIDDISDTVAAKRARNTLAARKSRQKKADKMAEMAAKIDELQSEVEFWKNQFRQVNQS